MADVHRIDTSFDKGVMTIKYYVNNTLTDERIMNEKDLTNYVEQIKFSIPVAEGGYKQ